MRFIDVTESEGTVVIDGYSTRKTWKSAVKEMGKWIAENIDEAEGQTIVKYPEESLLKAESSCGGYFLEVEEVGSACRWDDERDEMEYADGNWYIICRLVR